MASEALDDVVVVLNMPSVHRTTAPEHCLTVITPPASSIYFLAAATTLSGVSFGQLMITAWCGAAAMTKAARRAMTSEKSAKRMVVGGGEEQNGVCFICSVAVAFQAGSIVERVWLWILV
jgi:hypothetical protein